MILIKQQYKLAKVIGLLLIITLNSSCIAIQSNSIKNKTLRNQDLAKLNGFYTNISISKKEDYNSSLWKQINYLKKDTLANWQNHKIELKVINKKKMRAKLWLNEAVVAEKIIKGKVKNGYFSVKRKLKIIGVPFIYFSVKDNKLELGMDDKKQLLLNSAHMQSLNILIMSGGNSSQFSGKYKPCK